MTNSDPPNSVSPDNDLLWKQYNLHADLYKAHLDLVVKLLTFYYAITGAILSYYFANSGVPMIRWSLGLPLLFSIGFAAAAIAGVSSAQIAQTEIIAIRDKLKLLRYPSLNALRHLLLLSAITCGAVAVGIIVLLLSCRF